MGTWKTLCPLESQRFGLWNILNEQKRFRWIWMMIIISQLIIQAKEIQTKRFFFSWAWMIQMAITTEFCSCRSWTHLYLDKQAGEGKYRCWQGTPCQLGPRDLPSWGAAAVGFLFFPLLVEWRKPTEWLFSTDIYSNVIGLGLMRSSSSVKSAQ